MADTISYPFDKPEGTVRVRLDGTPFRLNFKWNTRDEYWALSLYRDDGTALVEGMRLAIGVNLLRQFVGSTMPPGGLVLVDPGGRNEELDRDALESGRLQLVYLTEDEMAALAPASEEVQA